MYGEIAIGDSRLGYYVDEGTPNTEHPEDVPFHIQTYYYNEESWELINEWWEWEISFATAGTHTVKIERINPSQATYHTLDENFIPDTISRTTHIHNYYGVCSTDANVSKKTVNIDGFKLVEGAMVIIKFTNANNAFDPTLNVSGTGDYPMYIYGTTKFGMLLEYDRDRNWVAGAVQVFVYDGNGWIRDYWNYKEYTNGYFGHAYVTCSTDASTIAKTATSPYEYRRYSGGIISVKFENSVPANSTLSINNEPAEPLRYRGVAITDNIIKAGDVATFIYYNDYHLLSIDRWQEDIEEKADKEYVDSTFALKSDIKDVDLSSYETKEESQVKYNTIINAKADWNQNDPNAIDYVKNRTHWVEEKLAEFLEETTVTEVEADSQGRAFISGLSNEWFNAYGHTFIVTFDGVQYQCPAFYVDGADYIGNANLLDSDILESTTEFDQYKSEAPFLIESIFYSEEEETPWGEPTYNEWYEWNIYINSTEVGVTHTIKIEYIDSDNVIYHTLDERYIPDTIVRVYAMNRKMNTTNPTGTGSFSMNRLEDSTIGGYSHAEGYSVTASGIASHAEGDVTIASGGASHSEGYGTKASGDYSHAEGWNTIASGECQHVQGKYNIEDKSSNYAHIVGNGEGLNKRSNAHTLDWSGNAWYQGTIKVGGTSYNNASEVALKSDLENIDLSTYETKANAQLKYDEFSSNISSKQDKNVIVEYKTSSTTEATLGADEISTAADAGIDVKFFDGYEYLNLLEYSQGQGFAVFYTEYLDMNEVFTVKYVVIGSNGDIMMSDKKEYNLAYKSDLNAKQDKLIGTAGQFVQFDSNGKPVGVNLDLSAYETKEDAQSKYDTITNAKADWNQNDENAIDFIKNRTHWKYNQSQYSIISEKKKVTVNKDENFALLCYTDNAPIVGHSYSVDYATPNNSTNQVYQCVAYIKSDDDSIYIGGTANNYPFIIKISKENDKYKWEVNDNSLFGWANYKDFYIGIEGDLESKGYHPLDEQFIPSTIARKEYVDSTFAKKSDVQDVDLSNYYTKPEIDNLELITVDDIDAICGGSIQYAEEVLF